MKAEAYYQMMQFEYALMYYHRGNKIRPEVQSFRLGIQKSREAIENSIGGKIVNFCVVYAHMWVTFECGHGKHHTMCEKNLTAMLHNLRY